jgi:hypothetical protein
MWIDDIRKQRTAVNEASFALDTRTRDGPREGTFEIRAGLRSRLSRLAHRSGSGPVALPHEFIDFWIF